MLFTRFPIFLLLNILMFIFLNFLLLFSASLSLYLTGSFSSLLSLQLLVLTLLFSISSSLYLTPSFSCLLSLGFSSPSSAIFCYHLHYISQHPSPFPYPHVCPFSFLLLLIFLIFSVFATYHITIIIPNSYGPRCLSYLITVKNTIQLQWIHLRTHNYCQK